MKWWQRLREQFKLKGWSVAELERRSGISKDSLHKYLKGKVGQPRGDTMARLADTLDTSELWLMHGEGVRWTRVPIVGFVVAGEEFTPIDDHAKGAGLGILELDFDAVDPIAIEVRGGSNWPVYRQGDKLLCSRYRGHDVAAQVGHDCVIMTTDGRGYVKQFLRGAKDGFYTLRAYSPDYPDIENVEVQWVAPILWIRRAP